MTEPTRKVPTTVIELARKAMQNAPECLAKEVSKVHAIRSLVPDIRQMQSKGYDWNAIACLLSEHGIRVTAVTLKSYLQQAKARPSKRTHRKAGGSSSPPRSGSGGSRNGTDHGTASVRGADTGAGKAGLPAPPAAVAKQPAGDVPKTSRPPVVDAGARRSTFVPEEDTDDI